MIARTRASLLETAGRYAAERAAPVGTIIKELLHYEILYAMTVSGALERLVFQGGTCLRLCHGGNRYSEDLDFAGGADFEARTLTSFEALLKGQIAAAYGLDLDVKQEASGFEGTGVGVARWQARIRVPHPNPGLPQKQVINVEVAAVPARDVDFMPVAANYPHLPGPLRSLIVPAESPGEILADKIVALGARRFIKYRDVWDIKHLLDRGITPNLELVRAKLVDYRLDPAHWLGALERRAAELELEEHHRGFTAEMSRFVDGPIARQVVNRQFSLAFLLRSRDLARAVALGLARSRGHDHPG